MEQQTHATGPAYDTQPAGLEKWLDNTFNKNNPVKLPAGFTKWLANNVWWLTLVGAIFSLLSILSTWSSLNTVQNLGDAYGLDGSAVGALYAQSANVLYISMAVNAVSAVLLFMAFQKLKVHQKSGWNLVYYNMLLGITASLVSSVVFATYALVGGLIGVAIGLAIGGTLLFQIRKYFQ